jgi:hypothetical protein
MENSYLLSFAMRQTTFELIVLLYMWFKLIETFFDWKIRGGLHTYNAFSVFRQVKTLWL